MDIFQKDLENTAIDRINRFYKIALAMNFEVCLGFSGGKDSQVTYDLAKRSGIPFTAYYNRAFESKETMGFIKKYYPEVIWRHDHKFGFIENIRTFHSGLLPTVQVAYCCDNYKHNPKYVDKCSIVGVRKQESYKRKDRTTLSVKNKTTLKKNKDIISEYFIENCQSLGTASVIQLLPIVDWSKENVWDYIKEHNLPVNPEYNHSERVGCMVCPKASFERNYYYLMKYPKLIDAFILAREKSGNPNIDWIITSDNKDFVDDKPYYICRWLNHSFNQFTAKQWNLYNQVILNYERSKHNNQRSKV